MTCVPATRDPLDPCGTIFVNCPSLWLTCSTQHLGHSSLITVEHPASYLKKMLQRISNVLEVTWRRCYNVSGTSCKLLEEDVTTYQQRLASYLKKMLQPIRNVLQITWRRCYNVAGNRYWQRRPQDAITIPPTPQPPPTPPEKKMWKSDNSPALPWAPSP